MPAPCAQNLMRAARLAAICGMLALAACGGGGGGGSSGGGGVTTQAQTSTVTLKWAAAAGPVKGYDVWVQRNGGRWRVEQKVASSKIVLKGAPGDKAKLAVGGYDSKGRRGPISVPSPAFKFPADEPEPAQQPTGNPNPSPNPTPPSNPGGSGEPTQSEPANQPVDPAELVGGILWQSERILRVTSPWLETLLAFVTPTPATQLAGTGDFDGDDLDDPLWVDESGLLSFTPLAALASGAQSPAPVVLGMLDATEQVLGSGDFDADGHEDVLVLGANGRVDAWLSDPSGASAIVPVGNAGTAQLAVVRDFDANGSDDLVWRGADGALQIWLMDDSTPAASVELPLDPALEILAAGDFDGDASAELAVRDATGRVLLLFPLAAAPLEPVDAGVADTLGWPVLGSADLDGDGGDDLAFASDEALRSAYLPGEEVQPLDPNSPWAPIALLR